MKNNILFVAALAMALFCSCDRKADFKSESFVTLDATRYSVSEADGSFLIPVSIINPVNEEVQVIINVSSDTAVEGKDFTIKSPLSKVLTFGPGEEVKNIEVELIHDTEMTGPKSFDLSIQSADETIMVGNFNTTSCVIRDKEHPLGHFIGEWTGETYDQLYGTNETLTITISEVESDTNKLKISNLDPLSQYLSKSFSLTAYADESKTSLSIAPEQPIGKDGEGEEEQWYLCTAFSGSGSFGLEINLLYSSAKQTLTIGTEWGSIIYVEKQPYYGSLYTPVVFKKK